MSALTNCLPPEILAYILENAVVDQRYTIPPSQGRTNVAFYNLLAVCRYWREVALAHGPIWSALSIIVENSCAIHHHDYLRTLLHRFQDSNLSVAICANPELKALDVTLLDILLAHSRRISRLDVKSMHASILERLNSRKGQFPSLSRVTISMAFHSISNNEWTAFEIAPSLESLSLRGGVLVANGAKSWYEWNLPYHSLRKLSLSSIRAEDGCRALSVAPCLEELYVKGCFYTDGMASPALLALPELPSLHTYDFAPLCDNFDDTIPEFSTRIAAHLLAPNLHTLRCHADNFQYFASMCGSSRCALKTLELHSISVQNEDNVKAITSFLRTTTTLESLSLSFTDPIIGGDDPANEETYILPLDAFFHSEHGPPTFPHLRTLQLNGLLMTGGVSRSLKHILSEYKGLEKLDMDIITASRHFQFIDYPVQPPVSEEQEQCWEELIFVVQSIAQSRNIKVVASITDGNDFNKSARFEPRS